ncbi:hypothetical protein BH09BAC3_BH09BAC3_08740 [soil metagenome]
MSQVKKATLGLLEMNPLYWFIAFCCISLLFFYALNIFLISENLYFNFYADLLSYERILEVLRVQKQWQFISYSILPIYYLAKFTLVASCISVGVLLTRREISFKTLFQISITAEIIFLLPSFVKLIWFGFFHQEYTLTELQQFYPFSILNILNVDQIAPWFLYPLQLINVFELAYWFAIAYQLKLLSGHSLSNNLSLVASTYGVGLLLWSIVMMFIVVSVS